MTSNDYLQAGRGFLARWFRFQPSEIDALETDDFIWWIEEGLRQKKAEAEANAQALAG